MARLSRLLGRTSNGGNSAKDELEEAQWLVGGRYEVLQPTVLHARPDLASHATGRIIPRETALLLAQVMLPPPAGSEGQEQVLLAYLANTKRTEWIAGWAQIRGPPLTQKVLRRRRLRGSWQVGGRYRVLGKPLLRAGIELESPQVSELSALEAEVLVLDLGLVLRDGEPRLRGYVRTDGGVFGWLTIEGHGAYPFLEAVNLYTADAVSTSDGRFKKILKGKSPSNLSAAEEDQLWQRTGLYRALAKVSLYENAELESKVVGSVRKNSLVTVHAISHVYMHQGSNQIRLQVEVEGQTEGDNQKHYWLSPMSAAGELLIDFRDQLEYQKLLASHQEQMRSSAQDGAEGTSPVMWSEPYTVVIDRSTSDSVGLVVDHADGATLVIDALADDPNGLFLKWNAAHPEEMVCAGDRIVAVNGRSGNALDLVKELSLPQEHRVSLQRPADVNSWAGGIGELPADGHEIVATLNSNTHVDNGHSSTQSSGDDYLPLHTDNVAQAPGDLAWGSGSHCTGYDNDLQHAPVAAEPYYGTGTFGWGTATFGGPEDDYEQTSNNPNNSWERTNGPCQDHWEHTSGPFEDHWERTSGPSKMTNQSSPSKSIANADEPPFTPKVVYIHSRDCSPDAVRNQKQLEDDPAKAAQTRGVARPFLPIDEGPETKPFGDPSVEVEAPEFKCPCRGQSAGDFFNCGTGSLRQLLAKEIFGNNTP